MVSRALVSFAHRATVAVAAGLRLPTVTASCAADDTHDDAAPDDDADAGRAGAHGGVSTAAHGRVPRQRTPNFLPPTTFRLNHTPPTIPPPFAAVG